MKKRAFAILLGVLIVVGGIILLSTLINPSEKAVAATTQTTAATSQSTSETTKKPDPDPIPSEADVEKYSDEYLEKKCGEPRVFKNTSTKLTEGERVKATGGIYDAVTFKVSPKEPIIDGVLEEMLSNPIYLSGVDLALREVGLVGQSDWAKKFHDSFDPVTTEWWEKWIEKDKATGVWHVTKEYHLIAARYCCIVEGMQYIKAVEGCKVKAHFPLNVEMEVCYKSTSQEKYPFWVFKFQFKDGRKIFIGINQLDYRWAIIPPVATPTPTKKVTPTPTETKKVTPTPPSNKPKSKKNDPIVRNTNPNVAADIGSKDNPGNHDNNTKKTPEPTSPKSFNNTASPTPKPTATSKPTATPTNKPKATPTRAPAPSKEPAVKNDGINQGPAPKSDPDDK